MVTDGSLPVLGVSTSTDELELVGSEPRAVPQTNTRTTTARLQSAQHQFRLLVSATLDRQDDGFVKRSSQQHPRSTAASLTLHLMLLLLLLLRLVVIVCLVLLLAQLKTPVKTHLALCRCIFIILIRVNCSTFTDRVSTARNAIASVCFHF